MEIELCAADEEITLTVSTDRLAKEIGDQGILGGAPNSEFLYLAALALETHADDNYDIEDSLMEFLRNSYDVDVNLDECNEIEAILR